MPRSDQPFLRSSAAHNLCPPERSLAMSEAIRQTQSKDPVFAGAIGDDTRRSHTNAWTTSILITLLLLLAVASFSQTGRFPGKKSELTSSDGRWVLQDVNRNQGPKHSIFLKDRTGRKTRKICDYERSVGLVWSPDSRRFAMNDYAGSNYTEVGIYSVDESAPKIDLQKEILDQDKRLRERVKLVGFGHDYFGVARWLDAQRVVVHDWGHNDEPAGIFLRVLRLHARWFRTEMSASAESIRS